MARPAASRLNRGNLGFLLAKAMQRWNELLYAGFSERGFPQVRPSFGSILIPLFEEDGLRIGELARRSRLSKQTMTTMVRLVEKSGLVKGRADAADARAVRVFLTPEARRFRPTAETVLAELEAAARRACGSRGLTTIRHWLAKFAAAGVPVQE
jgi:DNA-binding MarR family transcriptional regulator